MDPTNNPIPAPGSDSSAGVNPNLPPEPASGTGAPVEPAAPVDSALPVAPVEPVAPVAPGQPPVNPVINPTGGIVPPVNPVIQPGGNGLAATDPIMQPEPAPEPDPIEEELKAPMKAAGPVPGSIGSAVSGPAGAPAEMPSDATPASSDTGQVPSVAFNDPAMQAPGSVGIGSNPHPEKKKNTTLLILIAVAAVIVVALAGVLIFMFLKPNSGSNSGSSSSSSSSQTNNNSSSNSGTNSSSGSSDSTGEGNTLSCTRNMTDDELIKYNDVSSGTISISAEFEDGEMSKIALVNSLVYNDEDATDTEPVEDEIHEAVAADLTPESALNYYLSVSSDGALDLSFDAVEANYADLDFICETL